MELDGVDRNDVSHLRSGTCPIKVESLLETFGMSPGDIGDIHGPWRHWRRLATFVCDIHLLATLATFVGDIQQRMSPGHSLRETNAKMSGLSPASQNGGPQHECLLETFV